MKVIKAPNSTDTLGTTVFLGGTIDNGDSIDWQTEFANKFESVDVTFLNPRREKWITDIEQSIDCPIFREQLEWESFNLEYSDYILINLLADSKSIISVAELAEYGSKGKKMVVCCPKGFWRNGNVEFLCEKFSIPLFREIEHVEHYLRNRIKK